MWGPDASQWVVHTAQGEVVCTGTGAFKGWEYSVAVPTSCLGNPTGLRVVATAQQYGAGTGPGWTDPSVSTPLIPAS
jgi:hypothetical protein